MRLAALLALGAASVFSAPAISRQPANVMVTAGRNATFTVQATGLGKLSYQWRRSGFPIAGATDATYVIGGASRTQRDWYDVVVTDAEGSTVSQTAALSVAPTEYPTNVASDPGWDLRLESATGVYVRAVASLPDGGFIAAGKFASANGTRRSAVLRVNADGSLDSTFVPPEIASDDVRAIAVQADGKVIIGGRFQSVGGRPYAKLARLNLDGSLDTSFDAGLTIPSFEVVQVAVDDQGRIFAYGTGGGPQLRRFTADGRTDLAITAPNDASIESFVLQPDGKIVIATIDSTQSHQFFRLNASGSTDTSFKADPIRSDSSRFLALDRKGGLLIGGRLGITRLLGDGTLDQTFHVDVDENGVASIAVQPDGALVVAGSFSRIAGVARSRVARLRTDGTLDGLIFQSGAIVPLAVAVAADGRVILAGTTPFPTSNSRIGIVRYQLDGSLDTRVGLALRAPGTIGPVVALPNDRFMVFGAFDTLRGVPSSGVAKLDGAGNVDGSFKPGFGPATPVTGVATAVGLPDGRVVIGGSFTDYGGVPRQNIALLKGDGSLDKTFNPPPDVLGRVACLAVLPSGQIIAAAASGTGVEFKLVVFNLDGTVASSFSDVRFDAEIKDLVVRQDGTVFVGGFFTHVNGTTSRCLAKLLPNGTLDLQFAAQMQFSPWVWKIALAPAGKLIVGAYPKLLRLNPDGGFDSTFLPIGVTAVIGGMLVQEDGKVIVRAPLPTAGSSECLLRLNADGQLDGTFRSTGVNPAFSGSDALLLMRDNGQLVLSDGDLDGGQFIATAKATAPELRSGPTAQTVVPGGSTQLVVVANSLLPVTYQWLFNGVAIPGATTDTLAIANFGPGQAGQYSVRVTNSLGTTTSDTASVDAPSYDRGRLTNLSIRTVLGTGAQTVIVGAGLGGAGTTGGKHFLARAVGPTLRSKFGVTSAASDVRLELYQNDGFKIDENDDWAGIFDFASVGAFGFDGSPPRDAAIYNPVASAGTYSLHMTGKAGATGIALAEIYDATPAGRFTFFTPRLVNGSARTQVGTGDDVLILGFVIGGQGSVKLLLRGIGPTLAVAPYNVPGTLTNPKLQLYNSASVLLAENDNWGDANASAAMNAAFTSVGAFSLLTGSKDAALVATLPPGSYTAVVRGVSDETGVALVELYELP